MPSIHVSSHRSGILVSLLIVLGVAWTANPCSAQTQAKPVVELDPILDTGLLVSGLTLGLSLELILSTGELTPQQPGDTDKLSPIDRPFATRDNIKDYGISNFAAAGMIAYAATDMVLAELLDREDPWYSYAVMYLQSAAITLVATDLLKIAVRRPRPEAYREVRATGMATADTNTSLSFVSGHAAIAGALSGTAVYLAFNRDSSAAERWGILSGAVVLTGVVSTFRVLEGKHFPTDVIAGAAMGATIGVFVPYLHRPSESGVTVLPTGAGLAVSATF